MDAGGRLPALSLNQCSALTHLLQGSLAVTGLRLHRPGRRAQDVDFETLRDCIVHARRSHGWLAERDLFELAGDRLSRDPESAEGFRRRWDVLLVDDRHALGAPAAAMVDQRAAIHKMEAEGTQAPQQAGLGG